MRHRKLISLLLALCLAAFVGYGCSDSDSDDNDNGKGGSGGSGGSGVGGGGGGGGIGVCYGDDCEDFPDFGGDDDDDDDPSPGGDGGGDKQGKCDKIDQCEGGSRWRCEGSPDGYQTAYGFKCVNGCYKLEKQKKCYDGCFAKNTDCSIPGY